MPTRQIPSWAWPFLSLALLAVGQQVAAQCLEPACDPYGLPVPPPLGYPSKLPLPPPIRCVPPASHWYVFSEATALTRDQDDALTVATLNTPTNTVLSTDDFEYDFEPGGRLVVGHLFSQQWGLEARYLSVDDWFERASFSDDTANALGGVGNLFSPFTDFGNPAVAGLDFNRRVAISQFSELDSWEITLRQRLPTGPGLVAGSFFYGLRHFDINEQFNYASFADVPLPLGAVNRANVGVSNDLLGVQIGTLVNVQIESCWWIDVEALIGLYRNQVRRRSSYDNVDNFGVLTSFDGQTSDEVTSFVGEVSATLTYQITDILELRLGYRAIFADRLALASENFPTDVDALRLGNHDLENEGSLVYHGPHIGVTVEW